MHIYTGLFCVFVCLLFSRHVVLSHATLFEMLDNLPKLTVVLRDLL